VPWITRSISAALKRVRHVSKLPRAFLGLYAGLLLSTGLAADV
jgi:hypothetical protein